MHRLAARQQLSLLGGVTGRVIKGSVAIDPALVLIQRDIEVVTENGLRTEFKNIANVLTEEVGTLTRGDVIEADGKSYGVTEVLNDDGFVVKAVLRG